MNDVGDTLRIIAVAHGREQPLIRFVRSVVVCAEDERGESAVVRRRHHFDHLRAVGIDRELLVALEHIPDSFAFDDEHRTERRLKQLRLFPDLLEHRIGPELQEETDHGTDRLTLSNGLELQRLQFLRFRRCHLTEACLPGKFLQPGEWNRVVSCDSLDRRIERLQRRRCLPDEKGNVGCCWISRHDRRSGRRRGSWRQVHVIVDGKAHE
jgi:hypothetical protein